MIYQRDGGEEADLRNEDFATALFRMDLPGRHVRQLTSWSLPVEGPDLSPARSGPTKDLIVFQVARPGSDGLDIATVPATCRSEADCTSRIRYVTDGTGRATSPSWSPDGRRIAFSFRTATTDLNGDVWTMRPDGSDRRRVSTSPTFDYGADWGPA
ncbi:PD40 domain-containing protein [Actinoplanes sp. LDG1-06]|uniref:PD40 domain-containing protein n=1 Tax=Paractinoplanes ovalisporus TaxID=2810368 RepID=A0ABS2A9D1_9ACTN|nr:PD40 domain-containing protein [Actinoplanes ovalisporus]MBM2616442.1 PD40 domain-containing protein [Actinoplanes ovalisporus]